MPEPIVVTISPNVAARVRDKERFNAALERAASLRHELVASPERWESGDDGDVRVMYASGTRVPLEPGEISPSNVALIGARVARALAAVHAAGHVHGAITAEALVQTTERGVRLGRGGLFTALCDGGLGVQDAALGLSDSAYVAPEVQKGRMPDERSDVFSLGASLYELLTGKPPYGGRTTSFVMASVLTGSGGGERTSGAVAGPVVDALLRAIERAPEDRWPSADAFAQALTFGATSGEMRTPSKKQGSWLSAIFRSWFPARRSRG